MQYKDTVNLTELVLPTLELPAPELQASALEYMEMGGRDMAVRNLIYVPLLKNRDLVRAEAVSQALVGACPDSVLFWRDRVSLLLRQRDSSAASAGMEKVLSLQTDYSDDPNLLAQAIQVYLLTEQVHKALPLAMVSSQYWSEDQRLCMLAMKALYRSGQDRDVQAMACDAALVLGASAMSDLSDIDYDALSLSAGILLSNGHVEQVLAIMDEAKAIRSGHAPVLLEFGRALYMSHNRYREAPKALEACINISPKNTRAIDLLARVYFSNGDVDAAVRLLEAVEDDARTDGMRMFLARSYMTQGKFGDAVKLYEDLAERDPNNTALRRQYIGALLQMGDGASARNLYESGLAQRRTHLPRDFAQAIREMERAPPRDVVPTHRLNWIWSVLEAEGCAPLDRRAWEDQLSILNRVDHLLLDWMECNPNRLDDLREFVGDTTRTDAMLEGALAEGQGAFVVNAHLGVLFGGPLTLELNGFNMAWVASVPKLGVGRVDKNLISTTTMDDAAIGRSILRKLREGAVVLVAIDGSANRQRGGYYLFNRQIRLSDFVPRLAYRRKTPSFFSRLPLRDGTLCPELIRMPDPHEQEDVDSYVDRWMQSYLDNIRKIFYEAPETLRASGGFWTSLTE